MFSVNRCCYISHFRILPSPSWHKIIPPHTKWQFYNCIRKLVIFICMYICTYEQLGRLLHLRKQRQRRFTLHVDMISLSYCKHIIVSYNFYFWEPIFYLRFISIHFRWLVFSQYTIIEGLWPNLIQIS